MKRKLKKDYTSLESIKNYLMTKTDMECSIVQDQWTTGDEMRLTPGKKCILIKKSGTAGAKVNLLESTIVDIHPVAPSNFINNLTQRGILAFIIHAVISGGQNTVANEVENYLIEIQEA